jgi:hypothetical protein
MKRFWFPISIVAVLLILLGALAGLQYRWLGKISDDERERMQKRLEIDAQRFAEDFNREFKTLILIFSSTRRFGAKKTGASLICATNSGAKKRCIKT